MQDFLFGLLQMSLFGSLPAILLILMRKISQRLVSRLVIYYLWLLVLLRLCIPVGVTVTIPAVPKQNTRDYHIDAVWDKQSIMDSEQKPTAAVLSKEKAMDGISDTTNQTKSENVLNLYLLLIVIWGIGVVVCLCWHILVSVRFSRRMRRLCKEADTQALGILRQLEPEGRVGLARCSGISTPMLFGIRHPIILLPECIVEKEMLKDIILHELVHAKRYDLVYKWFVRIVMSLYWFHPMMYLIRQEIDRCCELSCDEAVIAHMNADERRRYGQMLLDIAGTSSAGRNIETVALCEEKLQLKERLKLIGKYRKKGVSAAVFSILSVLAVSGCAAISDARVHKTEGGATNISKEIAENQKIDQTQRKQAQKDVTEPAQNHSAEQTGNQQAGIQNVADDLKNVLTDKEPFFYYAEGADAAERMNFTDILDIFNPGSSYAQIERFAVIDLNSDGENEVLLHIIDVGLDGGGYLILRSEDGKVYGYPANYKMFTQLKTDGTFVYISLARPDEGIGTIRFREKGYEMHILACSETSDDMKTVTYQAEQKPVSEQEFAACLEQHRSKTDAVWYPFTAENIHQIPSKPAQINDLEQTKNIEDTNEEPELYYEKDGRQYELVQDLITGKYLWANVLTQGRQVKDDYGHKQTDPNTQKHYFESLDHTLAYPVRRWDNLLYSAGDYLIFEYDRMVYVSKHTDLYHPVLSLDANSTWGMITKVPMGYMIADQHKYEINFYDENFQQIKVLTGLRAGESGNFYVDGLMGVRNMETGQMGFLDEQGELIIPCEYALVTDFSNGFASVLTNAEIEPFTEDAGTVQMFYGKGGQWGIIDKKGQFVIKPSQQYANESPKKTDTQYFHGIRRFGPVREDGTVDFIASDEDERVLETLQLR